MKLGALKPIVLSILTKEPAARDDDHYLYCKVLERIDPMLLNIPMIMAFTSPDVPRFESVRRTRQKVQAEHEELCPSADTECARMLKQEEYKEFAING